MLKPKFSNTTDRELLELLCEAWREAANSGIVGGTYYSAEDVEIAASEWEISITDEQKRAALKRFNSFEIQDGETLVDAIREVTGE